MFSLPNILTWLRLLSAPVLIAVFLAAPDAWRDAAAAFVFLTAMATDFLDGWLARRYQTHSRFGEFLDPVADKIVVTTALLLLLGDAARADMTPPLLLAALIIICREICVSALREWMATIGERQHVNVSALGKWKTGFQTAAIALLLYRDDLLGAPAALVGGYLLWVAAILTLWSMVVYLRAARRFLLEGD